MLSQRELEGWHDARKDIPGWSSKIGKWKWVTLQAIGPMLLASPMFLLFLFRGSAEASISVSAVGMASILIAFAFSGRWDDDQASKKKCIEGGR